MLTFKLRQDTNNPLAWAVLIYKQVDENNPAQGQELAGVVTFQGAKAQAMAADYFDLQTNIQKGKALIHITAD